MLSNECRGRCDCALFDVTEPERSGRAMISTGAIWGIATAELAIASPDAASAPARPVFLRLGDFVSEIDDGRLGVGGGAPELVSFIDPRRKILRFFELTEYRDAPSELSGAARRAEVGMLGRVWLARSGPDVSWTGI